MHEVMTKAKGIVIRVVLVVILIITISFFFGASFYLSAIIVSGLGIFSEMVHTPENLPGAVDNPEGKYLHPAKAIFIGFILLLILVGIGILFPGVFNYGFGANS